MRLKLSRGGAPEYQVPALATLFLVRSRPRSSRVLPVDRDLHVLRLHAGEAGLDDQLVRRGVMSSGRLGSERGGRQRARTEESSNSRSIAWRSENSSPNGEVACA